MNIREKLADWISGGALTRARDDADFFRDSRISIGVSLDDAKARANLAEDKLYALQSEIQESARNLKATTNVAADLYNALRDILTARNITEARKIAREALGEAE